MATFRPQNRIFHYAWLVLVAATLSQAGTMGVLFNCNGLLFSAIISDLGFRPSELSIFYTIRSLSVACTVGVLSRLAFRKNCRVVMAALGCLMVGSAGLMSVFHHLWQWYLAAVFYGMGMSCIPVVLPVVLNNWFRVHNGLILGVTMASSGIVGALFSPVCAWLIQQLGWRTTALIMAGLCFLLTVVPSWFFLFLTPEEVGLRPYGEGISAGRPEHCVPTASAARPDAAILPLTLIALISASYLVQINAQLPTFAQSIGYTLTVGAALTSFAMVGNLAGKIGLGFLADLIGVYRAARFILLCVMLSMLLFLALPQFPAALYLAAALYGLAYSILMTSPPLLYRDLYPPEECQRALSRLNAVNGAVSAVFSFLVPLLYDLSGSFRMVFLIGIAVCAVSWLLMQYLQRYSQRLHSR